MSSRKASFSGPETRTHNTKKIVKSPYASRPTITVPIPRPKQVMRETSKKMQAGQFKPKTHEEQHGDSSGRPNVQNQQEVQQLSNLEGGKSKISHEKREDTVSPSEDRNSKEKHDEPLQSVPQDITDEREQNGIQSDFTQTENNNSEITEEADGSMKDHNITTSGVTLKSLTSSLIENTHKKMESEDSISSEICTYHEGETFIMFCSDCKLSVCSECIRTEHKEHEWIQLHKAGKIMRQKLAQYRKDIIKTHLPNFLACLEQSRLEKEKIHNQRKKKMEEILVQRDKIIAKVSELSQAMLSSCEDDLKKNENTIHRMENNIAELELVASKLEDTTLNCASDAEIVQMETRLSSILHKTVPTEVTFNRNVNFIPGEIDVDEIQIMIGKLSGLENDDVKHADDTPTDQDVSIVNSRSPRRPILPLNDFQKCVQCKRMVKNVVKVKYTCGHKICKYCWFSSMNGSRCPTCNTI